MTRVAVFLTILAIIFWIAFGFFARAVSPNDNNARGDIPTLLIFLALTVGVIWALYGMSVCFARRFAAKKRR